MMRAILRAIVVLAALPLRAHDFWLEPSEFRPPVGASVTVALLVGEHLRGELVSPNPSLIERFVAINEAGETPVGEDFTVPDGGLIRVVYRSRPSRVVLGAEKFEQYLREEGLERIVDVRAKRGQSTKEGRELFSRCAKSLILPQGAVRGEDRPSGLPLEIIAESKSSFVVRYRGAPLQGALVMALNGSSETRARTDRAGRVRFSVAQPGFWLIKTVHMIEAPKDSDADWESLWASLTFEAR